MTKAEQAVVTAAIAWWASHRPGGWSLAEHMASPLVNTTRGEALALAVKRYLETKRRCKKGKQ